MTTQIATDTELSAVNSILGSIGQSPITSLSGTALQNPEISFIYNLLQEVNKDVQTTASVPEKIEANPEVIQESE